MPSLDLETARQALREHFGYSDFRPQQRRAVQAVLSGRDALIVLPTGGGKSICFQVPALVRPGLTVVVSPLISLMADQVQALQARGIAAEFLNSTLTPDESACRTARLRSGALKLLYVAPERLMVPAMLEQLRGVTVAMLAVDEAHCVSAWGHDFRPSYLRLRTVRQVLRSPQTIALTATATPEVRRDIKRMLDLRESVELVGGFDRPNLHFGVEAVKSERARTERLVALLRDREASSVVYAATRRQVEQVTRALLRGRVQAVGYHAGLSAEQRAQAQDAFMRNSVPIIVATNAFGMGVDKSNVRLVVHYAMSGSLEDYYQEAGRGGRDGGAARCVLLFHPSDRFIHDRFRDASTPSPAAVRHVHVALQALADRTGRLAVDTTRIGLTCRPAVPPQRVQSALELLERAGVLLPEQDQDAPIRVRVLATPLRLCCEESALSTHARRILSAVRETDRDGWCGLLRSSLGLRPFEVDEALLELESRQLVFVERPLPLAQLVRGAQVTAALDRALEALAHRRTGEQARLASMVGYATTRRCRRNFILRYFGESTSNPACGRCDNCDD